MHTVKYMVKYRTHGKWVGPYMGNNSFCSKETLKYPTLELAKIDERYVKIVTKSATKIVKV